MEIQNITGSGVMPTSMSETSRPEPPRDNQPPEDKAPVKDETRGNIIDTRA